MKVRLLITGLLLVFLFGCSSKEIKKPNIIVILIDDAGYADFGFAGCNDLKTPNIDKLANNGIVFTDAHVTASVCGPSRAGLITGRYQQRFGFECNPSTDSFGLDTNELTLANAMKANGYVTAAFGKWHLGDIPGYKPLDRGFDYFYGFHSGGRHYFRNKLHDVPNGSHSMWLNDKNVTFEGYLTDALGDNAVNFIEENKTRPFFMYWAPNAVHTPLEAKEEDLGLFEGHPRQMLAAMTWALDRAVGNIVKKLEQEQLLDNTLIFFLSDNGGATNNQSSNEPLKGFKGNKFEGGQRVPFFVHWPALTNKEGSLRPGSKFHGLTSSLDIFTTSVDAVGGSFSNSSTLDGVSLIPYLKGQKTGDPHEKLFWRKDKMAAVRVGDYKVIRVEGLGCRLYDVEDDLEETMDLSSIDSLALKRLNNELTTWEETVTQPRWTEDEKWNKVTFLIHEDLFYNKDVRVTNPSELKQYSNACHE